MIFYSISFYLIRAEIYDRMYQSWEENQLRNAFHQVWNVTPSPQEKTREAVPGPSVPHSAYPGRDAAGELAAAFEEGILEAAKQASLEIRAGGAPKVDSWLKSTDLCGPAVCPAPAGHGMYCPVDCPRRTQRDSELHELKDQMQVIVHTLGIKNIFKTHMPSEGASSVGKETEPSEEATEISSIAPSVDSKTTDARISRSKIKERVKISRSESTMEMEKARKKAQNAKRTASHTTLLLLTPTP